MGNDSIRQKGGVRNPLARAWNILIRPTKEWRIVEAEGTTWWYVCLVYIMPFIALTPLAVIIILLHPRIHVSSVLGLQFEYDYYAVGYAFFHLREFILGYGFVLIATLAMVFVVNVSAPLVSGKKNFPQALKLVAYGSTPLWLGKPVLVIVNVLFRLNEVTYTLYFILFVIYAVYLLHTGLPVLMKTPQEKWMLYMGGMTGIFLAYAVLMFLFPLRLGLRIASLWSNLQGLVQRYKDAADVAIVIVAVVAVAGLAIYFARRKERSAD